jgi:hypothetical protein
MGFRGQTRISAVFELVSSALFDLRSRSSSLWINLLFTESWMFEGRKLREQSVEVVTRA